MYKVYKLPFIVYAVMSKEQLIEKIQMVEMKGWVINCEDVSYTSRCEVFIMPKTEKVSCKNLNKISNVTVDCFGFYE